MSFSDAIGKLQSVLSSLGTGESKQVEKQEEYETLFEYTDSKIENTDVDGISSEYSSAQQDVEEQLLINKKVSYNEAESAKWNSKMLDTLYDSDIPSSLKEELMPLYEKLSEATDENQRASLNSKIKQICIDAEKEGIVGDEITALSMDMSLSALRSAKGKDIKGLYEKLADTTSENQRNKIYAEIYKRQEEYEVEDCKQFIQLQIEESDYSNEQKGELSNLFNDMASSSDITEWEKFDAQIDKYCLEQGIDTNSYLISGLKYNAMQSLYHSDMATYYEEIKNTSSEKKIESLEAEKNQKRAEYGAMLDSLEQQTIFSEMNLSDEAHEKLISLSEKLSYANDETSVDMLEAKMKHILAEEGVDFDSREYKNLACTNLDLQQNKKLAPLYEKLKSATSENEKAKLNAQIRDIEIEYSKQYDEIWYS